MAHVERPLPRLLECCCGCSTSNSYVSKRISLTGTYLAASRPLCRHEQAVPCVFVRNTRHCNSLKPFLVLSQRLHFESFSCVVSLRLPQEDIRRGYTLGILRYVSYGLLAQMVVVCGADHGSEHGKKLGGVDLRRRIIVVDVAIMCLVEVHHME